MKLTKKDIKALQPYEEQLRTATRSDYARYVPMHAVSYMVEVMRRELPGYAVNTRCPHCLLQLYKDIGVLYFDAINKTYGK